MSSKDDQKSEGSGFADKSQIDLLLKSMERRYNKNTIKAALKTLPQPLGAPPELDDLGELTRILKGFSEAFGLELLWKELKALGFEPPAETREIFPRGGVTVSLDDISAWQIEGKYESNIAEDKKDGSHGLSGREMQITMLGDGFIKFIFKGANKIADSSFDVDLKTGDTISSSGSLLTVKHLSEQTPMMAATYAQATSGRL